MKDKTEFIGIEVGRKRVCIEEKRMEIISEWHKKVEIPEYRSFIVLMQFSTVLFENFQRLRRR